MSKVKTFAQAVRSGKIAISEDTAKVLLHISKLEKEVDRIYEEMSAKLDDGDVQGKNEMFDRIFSRSYYRFIQDIREEAGRMMARNMEEMDFVGL